MASNSYATDPVLGRLLTQLAYAVIWKGHVPEEGAKSWAMIMAQPFGPIASARMAATIGRAGSDLIRKDIAAGRSLTASVQGIATAALMLLPSDVVAALDDVVERLDTDVRSGLCPEAALLPRLIEEELARLVQQAAQRSAASGPPPPSHPPLLTAPPTDSVAADRAARTHLPPSDPLTSPMGSPLHMAATWPLRAPPPPALSDPRHDALSDARLGLLPAHPVHRWSAPQLTALLVRWRAPRFGDGS